MVEAAGSEIALEHRDKVQKAVADQQIVFRGELLPARAESTDEAAE